MAEAAIRLKRYLFKPRYQLMNRIRKASNLDREGIREVHLSAFPEGEKQIVATLAVDLLSETTRPETITLVAENDGAIIGHIAFSPVTLQSKEKWQGYILAPLGVKPEFQKSGIGSELINSGKKCLSKNGVNALFVYGDPDYYGKFGFRADTASGYSPPYQIAYPFGWQAIDLNGEGYVESTLNLSCVASLCNPQLW